MRRAGIYSVSTEPFTLPGSAFIMVAVEGVKNGGDGHADKRKRVELLPF